MQSEGHFGGVVSIGADLHSYNVLYTEVSGISVSAVTAANDINSGNLGHLLGLALAKADQMNGSPGDDLIRSFGGNDTVAGNDGSDTVFGGDGRDKLIGGSEGDYLAGNAGNHILSGGIGVDVLNGGRGKDSLAGGSGKDFLDFESVKDSLPSAPDLIKDFAGDKIYLSNIDARAGGGNNAFVFIGGDDFTGIGQLRVFQKDGNTFIDLNTSGDQTPEARIELGSVPT